MELTEELIEKISGYVRIGAECETAMIASGVPPEIGYEWVTRGKADYESGVESIYADLVFVIMQAAAQSEILYLQMIAQDGGAPGARFILETVNPGRYKTAKKKKQNKMITVGQ